jgi:hypothetical protein
VGSPADVVERIAALQAAVFNRRSLLAQRLFIWRFGPMLDKSLCDYLQLFGTALRATLLDHWLSFQDFKTLFCATGKLNGKLYALRHG